MPEEQAVTAETATIRPVVGPDTGQQPRILSAEQGGRILMLSGERVRVLSKQGWITKTGNGYTMLDLVQGYIRFLRDENRRTSKSAAASRVQDARAREIELRTAARERKTMMVEEHHAIVDELLGVLRTELGGLPARASRDLPVRRTIEAAIIATLTNIADIAAERAAELGTDRGPDETGEATASGPVGSDAPDASEHDGSAGSA